MSSSALELGTVWAQEDWQLQTHVDVRWRRAKRIGCWLGAFAPIRPAGNAGHVGRADCRNLSVSRSLTGFEMC